MKHSKNKTGFTLIEVLFALGIVGIVLTPLIVNQGNLLRWVARQSRALERIYAAQQFMVSSVIEFEQNNTLLTATHELKEPKTTLNFALAHPNKALKKQFRSLYKQQVTTSWNEQTFPYSDKLVTFVFLPELEKE